MDSTDQIQSAICSRDRTHHAGVSMLSLESGNIPGGVGLTAQSYCQTVTGTYNIPMGSSTAGGIVANDPLFLIGNGTSAAKSNAFFVSNSGHSVVYDTKGPALVANPIKGATYTDNIVYAWGDISSAGIINSSFGIQSASLGGGNKFTVILEQMTDQNGVPIDLTNASITATLMTEGADSQNADPQCQTISVSPLAKVGGFMRFVVWTHQIVFGGTPNCSDVPLRFCFKVCGRP